MNQEYDEDNSVLPKREGTPLLDVIDGSVNNYENNGVVPSSTDVAVNDDNVKDAAAKPSFKKLSSLTSITKWWKSIVDEKKNKRKKIEHTEKLRMRYKLQYHFMSPFQKYKLGRKPWKLAIQIMKIFIVTTQVILFGADRFASVAFIKNTEKAFKNLFLLDYDGANDFSYYSRTDLVNAIRLAHDQYYVIDDLSIGKYWHSKFDNGSLFPVEFCETRYVETKENMQANDINYNGDTIKVCENLRSSTNLSHILHMKHYFDRIVSLEVKFELRVIYLNGFKLHHKPECFLMVNSILIDNSKHDGRLRVSFNIKSEILDSCSKKYVVSKDAKAIKAVFLSFDGLVIAVCAFSGLLCMRSVTKSLILAKAAQKYFKVYKHEDLSKWDLFELVNKWFAVIVISDFLSVIGSIYKIYVDVRDIRYYNICSVFLGLGVVMVWIGLLRFFTYLRKYNILLITLRSAAPSLLRFSFCAMFMFFGFTFCGWIVLGPYHNKFTSFLRTAECLFSLLNGDDMYPTFASMNKQSVSIWIFSKVYLYTFVSLFIYVVLSTFISIIGDTYERLKDWGHMPLTRIERFMLGKKKVQERKRRGETICLRCNRENQSTSDFTSNNQTDYGEMLRPRSNSVLSESISVVSASLE